MNYTIETIADFCKGERSISIPGSVVSKVIIDHRETAKHDALFAAIKGARVDGHTFIEELLAMGVHHFLVSDSVVFDRYKGHANLILVPDVIEAIQMIAAEHRDNYQIPIIGITGSNGKTMVKEWLNTLLEDEFSICRSPKSFNSQIGVPLSLFHLTSNHSLALFEAGISRAGEMEKLQTIIRPTIGVFTNLGDAHAVHFASDEEKLHEKWKLFDEAQKIVCCKDQYWLAYIDDEQKKKLFTWSYEDKQADVSVIKLLRERHHTLITCTHESRTFRIEVPFTDKANLENAMQCLALVLYLGKLNDRVLHKFAELRPIAMRMEVKQGIEQSLVIDDSYNADLGSLKAALDQLSSQVDRDKLVILSDLNENKNGDQLYYDIAQMIKAANVNEMVGIGPQIEARKHLFSGVSMHCFPSSDDYWSQLDQRSLRNKAILVKGARKYKLEQLAQKLQARQHETVLEINLQHMAENLRYFKKRIAEETKLMVMVKAFAYGTGSFEVAHFLEAQKADYLAVAYTDEGVELRRKGIRLPIMVMSHSKSSYELMIQHDLEPEIFSLRSLIDFIDSASGLRHLFHQYPIHLKLDSGMHRLGFDQENLNEALTLIEDTPFIKVASVFTHLAATDDDENDDFTNAQLSVFETMADQVKARLGEGIMRHALNSTGVLRFPNHHFEMVRLGIGLYGFSGNSDAKFLNALGTLKSYIVQIRKVAAGESVGYGRKGVADVDRMIATVAIGYADGLDRRLSNGKWSLKWQGTPCPIVGNVCMDMVMIDVSGTEAKEGDSVIVLEGSQEVKKMAKLLDTIPYEVLTKISERVRRVYLQE